jgi:hypothetical protein
MTPELESLLTDVEVDLGTGDNLSPTFTSVKDMDAYLDEL